jgi:hypothetical protein
VIKVTPKMEVVLLRKKYVAICILVLLIIAYSLFSTFIFGNNYKHRQELYDSKHLGILANGLHKASIPQVEWSKLTCQERLSFLERLIMINYGPQIKEAVDNYYKELRGSDLIKITDVKVVAPYEYEMKIQISTHVGAHNPPYGLDVVTIHFHQLRDGKVVNFEHKDDN